MPIVSRHGLDPALMGALSYELGLAQREPDEQVVANNGNRLIDFARQRDRGLAQEQAMRDAANRRPTAMARAPVAGRGAAAGYGVDPADLLRAQTSANYVGANILGRMMDNKTRQQMAAMELANRGQQRQFDYNQGLAEQQNAWGVDSAEYIEKEIAGIQSGMAKQQAKLTPEGRRIYGELSGKLRAIQKQRGELRPDAYSKLLGQWMEEFNQSGVQDHIQEPPTPDQLYAQSVFPIPGTNSAFVVDPATGKGNIQKIEAPPTEAEMQLKEQERQFEQEKHVLEINKTRITAYSDWMKNMPKISDFMSPGKPGPAGPNGEPGTPGMPTFNEGLFNKMMAYWQRMDPTNFGFGQEQGLPSTMPGQGGQAAPGAPLPVNQPMTPEMQQAPVEQAPPEQGFDSMYAAAAALSGRQPGPRPDFWANAGVHVTGEGYPMFQTTQEADHFLTMMPAGEPFVDPEGNYRRKQ